LALTLLLSLSACDIHKIEPSTAQSDESLEVVNIGRLNLSGHLPLAIIENKYQDQFTNFKLRIVQNYDWHDITDNMTSGELAGTFILSPLAMDLIRKGFPGKIVLASNRNGNGLVLSKKIKSIADFKRHKSIIAVPHIYSQHHVLLHILLEKYGILKDKIKLVSMPPRDMIHYLQNGNIDGFIVGEPEVSRAISLDVGWMAAISPQIWKGHMDHVLLVSNAFIRNHPDKLQTLVNQLLRGGKFIESSPNEAAKIAQSYSGNEADVFAAVLTTPNDRITYDNMIISEAEMVSMAQYLVDMQLWSDIPEDLTMAYFDTRFAKKADQNIEGM
jgi:ABC-type nitrate/sulfonate/bicarbonate transport system substrate-binding protein